MRDSEQMTRVREARAALLLTHPFFGVLSLKLDLVEQPDVGTVSVDTAALRFAPDFVETLSNAELKGVVAHEVMHLALAHHARQGTRDGKMWNDAGDYAINPALIADGFALPAGALIDPRFDGMAAEQIYQLLRDEQQEQQPEPNGEGDGESQGNPCGDFKAAGPEGSAEAGQAESEWQENASEALRVASAAGKLPGGIKRVVEAALVPKADWRALLRRFMTDQIKTRSTWSARNKRFPDVYLPGRTRDGMGPLVIGIDTSGSISQAVLDRFAAEVSAIVADVEPAAVHVVYCDAVVNHVETFEHGQDVKLAAHGGGGTRFSPVFERVYVEGWQPAALVYLTDLACSDWPVEPSYPVLWASYDARGAVAPLGETIAID